MEIQDKNSLLNMFFAAKENSSFLPMTGAAESDFAGMVKNSGDVDVASASKVEFKADFKIQKDPIVKDEKILAVKEDKAVKKADVADKPEPKEKVESNKTESEGATNSDKENDINDAKDAVKSESNDDQKLDNETTLSKDEDVVEEAALVQVPVVENEFVVVADGGDVVLDAELGEIPESAMKETGTAAQLPDENNVSELMQSLTAEEELLVEQAKILDKKIGTDQKLKIDVSVEEEKIAEPIEHDVLKNRFEIDSLLQEVGDEVENTDGPLLQNDTDIQIVEGKDNLQAIGLSQVKIADAKVVSDTVRSQVDTSVLNTAAKEVVWSNVDAPKTEVFARLNETSGRDTLRGLGKEVVEQIKVNITKSAVRGIDTIDIQLKPEDLGKIQIKMQISKDGKLQAEIVSSRPETADLLQKEVSNLTKAFSDAGFDVDDRSFSFQNENQAREQNKDDSGLSQFIGASLEQEAENVAGNDNLGYYDPVLGLNIRV